MKNVLFVFMFLTAGPAFAAPFYTVKTEVSLNGQTISKSRIEVEAGKTAIYTQKNKTEESFLEVTASEAKSETVSLKFVTGLIDRNGKKQVLGTPSILVREKMKAEITSTNESTHETLAVSATVTRI